MERNSGRGELDGVVPHWRTSYDRQQQERPYQARGNALEVGQNRVAKSNISRYPFGRVLVCVSVDASLHDCVNFVLAAFLAKHNRTNLKKTSVISHQF